MFNVLIVDDEGIIRKGLINVINWKQMGCQICGEASDGIEGMALIKEKQPDIIISDIRMPDVDGLTMIRETKTLIPYSKFIILTGYRNFEYLQQAIELGAFEYILKPSKLEKICEVVKRAVVELNYELKKEEELNKLRDHFNKTMPILKEKLLYNVIFNINIIEEEIVNELELYNVNIEDFVMIIIEIEQKSDNNHVEYNKYLYQFGVVHTVEQMFTDEYVVDKVSLNHKQIAFIIQTKNSKKDFRQILYRKIDEVKDLIHRCFDFTISVGISSLGYGVKQLNEKIKECIEALEYKFYIGKNSLILYEDLSTFYQQKDDSVLKELKNQLLKNIKFGNEEKVTQILKDIYNAFNNGTYIEKDFIKIFYWNAMEEVYKLRIDIKTYEASRYTWGKNILSLYKLIDTSEDLKELHCILEQVALKLVNKIHMYNENNINLILKKAVDYIKNNYSQPITLTDVAENTYVSTYYLSRMFKKELKKNYVDYLNEIRIKKAKEYLKNDEDYKTYEIADLVGIQNPQYFSKIFKKYTGMTPTEYKAL